MALLHNDVFDNGLSAIDDNAENLYICNALPTTFAEASSTYKIGTKATPTIAAPSDKAGGGREVVVAAISDGVVNSADDGTHYGITDDSESKLLAAGALAGTVALVTGTPFTLTEFAIGIPDPA